MSHRSMHTLAKYAIHTLVEEGVVEVKGEVREGEMGEDWEVELTEGMEEGLVAG